MAYPTPMETYVVNGVYFSDTQSVTPTGSPFTFTNPQACRVQLLVSGGTVTATSMSSDLLGVVSLGILGGTFLVNPGYSVVITYILAPTLKYWCT